MEAKILVNILVEIAELEELRLKALRTRTRNDELTFSLHELQAEYEKDAADAARRNQGAELTVRGLETEIRQVSELVKVKEDLIIGVTDRRQLRALNEEISGLKRRLDRLEDETIGLLDQQDELKTESVSSASESQDHGRSSVKAQQDMAQQSAKLAEQKVHIEEELQRLQDMLPVADKRTVLRLREKLDQAVVHHHEGACQGCFNTLPRQQAISVDQGSTVVRCPSCMRYIVHRSWT